MSKTHINNIIPEGDLDFRLAYLAKLSNEQMNIFMDAFIKRYQKHKNFHNPLIINGRTYYYSNRTYETFEWFINHTSERGSNTYKKNFNLLYGYYKPNGQFVAGLIGKKLMAMLGYPFYLYK